MTAKPRCATCKQVLCTKSECRDVAKNKGTRTSWFTKYFPKHIGVYEVSELYAGKDLKGNDLYLELKFSYWDGFEFSFPSSNPMIAFYYKSITWVHWPLAWRGLAEKPKY